jgi:hypothetical protein
MNLAHKIVAVLLSTTLGSPLHAAAPGAATEVRLTPDTCAQVSEGDILTLNWDPAFDNPDPVSGLASFHLGFGRPDESFSPRRRPSLVLGTVHRGETVSSEPGITALPNGYFHLRFLVRLGNIESGTYSLIGAEAIPVVDPAYHGETPSMTNTPVRLPFCLNVQARARTRGRASLP